MSIRKKQVRLSLEELHQLKWLTGGVLALLSLWSLISLEMNNGIVLWPSLAVLIFTLIRPKWLNSVSSFTWKAAGPFILLLVAADFALSRTDFLPPLIRMVVLLLVYRVLAPRYQREDLQLVLICLFCLVISGVLTVSLLFAFQILIFAPLAMMQLFLICLVDRGGAEKKDAVRDWSKVAVRRLVHRVVKVADFKVLALGSILFGVVVAFSSMIFVVMPRVDIDQAIPFLQLQTEPKSGFSENVAFGQVSEIKLDNSVAFRVDVPRQSEIPGMPYWRMLVLDEYYDGGFRLSDRASKVFAPMSAARELYRWEQDRSRFSRYNYSWTFYVEGGVSRYLPLPGKFDGVRFAIPHDGRFSEDFSLIELSKVQTNVLSFQLEEPGWAHRLKASNMEIRFFEGEFDASFNANGDPLYPATTLELKVNEEDRRVLQEINKQIRGEEEARLPSSQYSQELTGYLRQNYRYSLRPDEGGGAEDYVVKWLREGKVGHCELFAGAFSLIARDAGYPTRLVVGFTGGVWNSVEAYFSVRNREAHAWVEIYDFDEKEWLRVDPTPGNSPPNPDLPNPITHEEVAGMNAWLDSLRIQWYRRIVSFDQSDQLEIAKGVSGWWKEFSSKLNEKTKEFVAEINKLFAAPFSGFNWVKLLFPVLVLILLGILWMFRSEIWGLWVTLGVRQKGLDPVRKEAGKYLRALSEENEWGLARRRALDRGVALKLKSKLEAVRFGPEPERSEAKKLFVKTKKFMRGK